MHLCYLRVHRGTHRSSVSLSVVLGGLATTPPIALEFQLEMSGSDVKKGEFSLAGRDFNYLPLGVKKTG